jgi:hypothetical protein
VPISIAALAGVQASEAGLASGLFNTSQQIGGALGIASLSAVAISTIEDELAGGTALPFALTDGFQAAFVGGAAVALAGVLVALLVVRRRDLAQGKCRGPARARAGRLDERARKSSSSSAGPSTARTAAARSFGGPSALSTLQVLTDSRLTRSKRVVSSFTAEAARLAWRLALLSRDGLLGRRVA